MPNTFNKSLRQSPAGCTCSSQPLPLTRETSPEPVEPLRPGSFPDAFSCSRSPGDALPVSSDSAAENLLFSYETGPTDFCHLKC